MNFYQEQLQKEINFIENKYLSTIIDTSENTTIENDFIIKKIILNETPYKIYRKNNDDFEILLVPQNLSDNNFDYIIKYKKTEKEINFSYILKKDNYVNLIIYDFYSYDNGYSTGNDFYSYDNGYSTGNYFYDEFMDNNNLVKTKNILNTNFIQNIKTLCLNGNEYRLDRIKRNKNETKINRINEKSILKAYNLYDARFIKIYDNDSEFLKILENLYKKESVKTRNK